MNPLEPVDDERINPQTTLQTDHIVQEGSIISVYTYNWGFMLTPAGVAAKAELDLATAKRVAFSWKPEATARRTHYQE